MSRDYSDYQIWDADEATPLHELSVRDIYRFSSPRIWGTYRIHYRASTNLDAQCRTLSSSDAARLKARLATALIDRIVGGEAEPLVDEDLVDYVKENQATLPIDERANRLLRFMTRSEFTVDIPLNFASFEPLVEAALGWSESINTGELEYFLKNLTEEGLIEETSEFDGGYTATIEGHRVIAREKPTEISSDVFIAMWINNETENLFLKIKEAVIGTGYNPIRIDEKRFNGLIDDSIVESIRASRFIIADLTHGDDGVRGSVYYEAGFARGLDKVVIQTIRKDQMDRGRVSFNLAHYPTITWTANNLEQFKVDLRNRIEELLPKGLPNRE